MTGPNNDGYFFSPTPPASQAPAPTPTSMPTRFGYAAPAQQTLTPSAPVAATRSLGWLLGAGLGLVVVIAVVVGFVVLAHKDKHIEGDGALRPIQQATNVQLESDLRSARLAEESYFAQHDAYTADLAAAGFQANSAQVTVVSAGAADYCLKATGGQPATVEYASKSGGVSSTPCG